jgi:hypothetical protein
MARRGTTVEIDLDELEKLCAMQSTDEELAAWFRVSTRTIERRRKDAKFAEAMERGKARGLMSIRRAQFRMLDAGNAVMGIWLGKQYLKQTDQIHHHVDGQHTYIYMPQVTVARPHAEVIDVACLPEPSGEESEEE